MKQYRNPKNGYRYGVVKIDSDYFVQLTALHNKYLVGESHKSADTAQNYLDLLARIGRWEEAEPEEKSVTRCYLNKRNRFVKVGSYDIGTKVLYAVTTQTGRGGTYRTSRYYTTFDAAQAELDRLANLYGWMLKVGDAE